MGVTGSAGAMPERGTDQAVARHHLDAVAAPARPHGVAFEVAKGGVDGLLVGVPYDGGDVTLA